MWIKLISLSMMALSSSCTISFQNISTIGEASDIVDENQDARADVRPNVTLV
jgi:hypothetical protein